MGSGYGQKQKRRFSWLKMVEIVSLYSMIKEPNFDPLECVDPVRDSWTVLGEWQLTAKDVC